MAKVNPITRDYLGPILVSFRKNVAEAGSSTAVESIIDSVFMMYWPVCLTYETRCAMVHWAEWALAQAAEWKEIEGEEDFARHEEAERRAFEMRDIDDLLPEEEGI